MTVMIVDDEKTLVKILKTYFENEGFNVIDVSNGEDAVKKIDECKIDLVILDWMIPKLNGIEVCKYIKENMNVKVLMLTAKTQVDDELEALEVGADDYMKKPFDLRILIKRAKKLLNIDKDITFNDIRINFNDKKVYKNNEILNLTKIEFDLLDCFLNNKGIILSRDKILSLVWGVDYEGDYRTVDTHIRRLRVKIGEEFIKTYRGIGYSLEVDFNKDKK